MTLRTVATVATPESSGIVKSASVLKKRKLGIGTAEESKQTEASSSFDVKLTNAKITRSLTAETSPITTGKSIEMDNLKSSQICQKS